MLVVFRADGGGVNTGIGHLMRCLSVAERLRHMGVHTVFVLKNFPIGVRLVQENQHEVRLLPADISIEEELTKIAPLIADADLIAVDGYEFTAQYLSYLRSLNKKVLYFDDLQDRELPVDIIVGNAYTSKSDYSLLPKTTTLLAGPAYLALRPEYQNLPQRKIKEHWESILINFGGEDPQNATKKTVLGLAAISRSMKLIIIVGAAYRFLDDLKKTLENCPHPFELYHDVKNMLTIQQEADLALSASGTSVWEMAATGMPMLLVQIADNQAKTIAYMQQNEMAHKLGNVEDLTAEKIHAALTAHEDKKIRKNLSKRCQEIVKGDGAEHIAQCIFRAIDKHAITFKRPDNDPESLDSRLLWIWRNEPVTRKFSRDSREIAWEEHKKWFVSTLDDPKKVLLIGTKNGSEVGTVRFDIVSEGCAEISIALDPAKRGAGLGFEMLKAACDYAFSVLLMKRIIAEINPENLASIKIFEANGFVYKDSKNGLKSYCLLRA